MIKTNLIEEIRKSLVSHFTFKFEHKHVHRSWKQTCFGLTFYQKNSTVFMYLPISAPHRLWDATGLENCYLPINVAA